MKNRIIVFAQLVDFIKLYRFFSSASFWYLLISDKLYNEFSNCGVMLFSTWLKELKGINVILLSKRKKSNWCLLNYYSSSHVFNCCNMSCEVLVYMDAYLGNLSFVDIFIVKKKRSISLLKCCHVKFLEIYNNVVYIIFTWL